MRPPVAPRRVDRRSECARAAAPLYRCRLERVRAGGTPRACGGPSEAAALLREMIPRGADRMHVVALALDPKHRAIGGYEVSVGTLTAAVLAPRECLKTAILLNADGLILGLNHVSGDPVPSLDTIHVVRDISLACRAVGIPLRDFIVLGDGTFVSLAAAGGRAAQSRAEELLVG